MNKPYYWHTAYSTGLPGTMKDDYPCITGAEGIKPSDIQVGGDHYKGMAIQPSEFIYKNKLNWLEGNAIKYICRHHFKNGAEDIDKAIHTLELIKEWHYGK